jgi:hypothetical protein
MTLLTQKTLKDQSEAILASNYLADIILEKENIAKIDYSASISFIKRNLYKTRAYVAIPAYLLNDIVKKTKLISSAKILFLWVYCVSFFNYKCSRQRSIALSLNKLSCKLKKSSALLFAFLAFNQQKQKSNYD